MRYLKIFITILLFFQVFGTFAQDTLKIDEAVKNALENNYNIIIAEKNLEIAKNNVNRGNAGMLPTIDASGSATLNVNDETTEISIGERGETQTIETQANFGRNYTARIQLNKTLFDGFNMFVTYDQLKEIRDRGEIDFQINAQNMLRELISIYYRAVTLKKNLISAEESIDISAERLGKVQEKFEVGAALKLEVLRAQVALNSDSTNFLELQLAFKNAKRQIAFLMGEAPNADFMISEEIYLKSIPGREKLLERTLQANNSINRAIKEKKISMLDRKKIMSSYYPRLSLSAGYNYNRTESESGFMSLSESNGLSAGLTASINLFNGFQTKNAVQNAEIRTAIKDVTIEQVRQQIKMSFLNSYENYKKRREIYKKEQQNLKTARLNFERNEELYSLGQVTSLELREAQLNLTMSKYRLNNAAYQTKLAETELLILSSQLMEKY